MINKKGQIKSFLVNYNASKPYNVEALLKEDCLDYTGFLITADDESLKENLCTINVIYEKEADMAVFASTEHELQGKIFFFKSVNSHAKCTTDKPVIEYGRVINSHSTTLHFSFN